MKKSSNIEKLNSFFSEASWDNFFSEALKSLAQAKNDNDQAAIDLIFRLMRGAVFLLGQDFGDSKILKNLDSIELGQYCAVCGKYKKNERYVAFSRGQICAPCAYTLVDHFEGV